jgi:hypothetical protein
MMAAANSPLVAGGAHGAQKAIRIRVLRPFLLRTDRVEVGTVLEVPLGLGAELISANKAERATDAPLTEAKPAKASAKAPAESSTKKES